MVGLADNTDGYRNAVGGIDEGFHQTRPGLPAGAIITRIAIAIVIHYLGLIVTAWIDLVNDHLEAVNVFIVAAIQPLASLQGVKARAADDGQDRHPGVGSLRVGQALESDGMHRAILRHGSFIRGRHPAQQVLVVGDGVLTGATVGRVRKPPMPVIAHHVPVVVVGLTVHSGGVRQAEAVPHLVLDHRDVGITPVSDPGDGVIFCNTVQAEGVPAAVGVRVQVGVEHHVDTHEIGKGYAGVGGGGAVGHQAGKIRVGVAVAVHVVDVIGARLRQVEPAVGIAAQQVDLVVGQLAPVVIETRESIGVHTLEESQVFGLD